MNPAARRVGAAPRGPSDRPRRRGRFKLTLAELETRRLSRLIEQHNRAMTAGEREFLLNRILPLKAWLESVGVDVIALVAAPS